MRTKLLLILLGLLGLFSAAIIFRVDQLLFADKLTWSEAQARAQMGALSQTLTAEMKSARETMELTWPQIQAAGHDFEKGRPYSRFMMMTALTKIPSSGEWVLDHPAFLDATTVRSWAPNYVTLALKGIREAQIPIGSTSVVSVLDPQRKVYFLIVTHTMTGWLAGLTGPELFQAAMDRQKGLLSSFFVVNPMGQTLGHTTPEYVGSLLSEDPLVAELMKNDSGSGSGMYPSAHGQVQGFYEQVPQTNLYVVVTTPVSDILGGRKEVRWQLILMGLGFGLVGAALIMAISGREKPPASAFPVHTGVLKAPPPQPPVSGPPPPPLISESPGAESVSVDAASMPSQPPTTLTNSSTITGEEQGDGVRMQAYTKAASSLAHELRGPLLSLLGRTRLLREKTGDTDIRNELLRIEEGAREAHGTLHKLLTFSGEKEEPTVPTALDEVITRSLRKLENEFHKAGISAEAHLADVHLIQGQPNLLSKAFDQILENSIEAMNKTATKKLTVILDETTRGPRLIFEDTGEGIEEALLNQIFDPFFTTKSANHSGLGLSLALGIIKACTGEVQVTSTRGQGTRIEVQFDLQAEKVREPVRIEADVRAESATSDFEGMHEEDFVVRGPGRSRRPSQTAAPIARNKDGVPTSVLSSPNPAAATPPPPLPEFAADPVHDVPSVLNDQLMEKTLNMIDQLDEVVESKNMTPPAAPPPRHADGPAIVVESAPPPPPPVAHASSTEPPPFPTQPAAEKVSEKIDKPKIGFKKKDSRTLETNVEVRRPGDRS